MKRTKLAWREGFASDPIRLVALDLDDTVLLPDKTISPRTARAIKVAASQGREIVLASARPLPSIASYAEELGIDGYCIGLNGSVVARLPEVEIVRRQRLDPELVGRIITLCEELQPDNTFLEFGLGFAAQFDGEDVAEYTIMSASPPRYIGDLGSTDLSAVCKVALRVTDTPFPTLERIRDVLGDEASYVIWEGPWSFIEILPHGTSKAAALQWVAAQCNVQRHEILAIGDERNDIEMLAWAGIGVAMGNAHPQVKAIADYVTRSVDEDGCAEAIEWFAHNPPGAESYA